MPAYLLAIDQGTTSTRSIIFDNRGRAIGSHQIEIQQFFPQAGWVEHDGEEIWQTVLKTIQEALGKSGLAAQDIAAVGISNQRETTLVWERSTGKLLHRAIVWQDRRTAEECQRLIAKQHEKTVSEKTGLLLDPYFSATKLQWILDHIPNARERAQKGELAFGTIDTFLIWRLTGGKVHATDATNASRTLLFNLHTQQWDDDLLTLFNIPKQILPTVKNCCDDFGKINIEELSLTCCIGGVAGDQQAATIGQVCFQPGMMKSTYGTGCFVLLNTGTQVIQSQNRLLTTIAYRFNDEVTYGLEGSIFVAGAAVQWLRDALHLIGDARDTEKLANSTDSNHGVYLVPAFTGLGAPYWDPLARGAILGLTRDSGVNHIVRAALEAVCYQTRDLLQAMQQDGVNSISNLAVDGGMVVNDWLMQFLSDTLNVPVTRPVVTETSSLGVAFLAGLYAGCFNSLEELTHLWQAQKTFIPNISTEQREKLYCGWLDAVRRVRG
ncbi:MAG: glycerol kinase GlpK [Legionellales bacterium]|nr:glycerol kinase GlpK [Legionellales bacterium]